MATAYMKECDHISSLKRRICCKGPDSNAHKVNV